MLLPQDTAAKFVTFSKPGSSSSAIYRLICCISCMVAKHETEKKTNLSTWECEQFGTSTDLSQLALASLGYLRAHA
jgi:hypothetical protein